MPKYYRKRRTYKRRYYRKKRYGYKPYRRSSYRNYRYRTKYIGRSFSRPTARKLGALYKRMGMRSKFTPSRYSAVKRSKPKSKLRGSNLRKKVSAIYNAAPGTVHMMNTSMNQRRIPSRAVPAELFAAQVRPSLVGLRARNDYLREVQLQPGNVFQNYVTPPPSIPGIPGLRQEMREEMVHKRRAFNDLVERAVANVGAAANLGEEFTDI